MPPRRGRLVAELMPRRGQLIRIPVDGISIVGRSTQGVIVFDTAEDERVVSVEHIPDENGSDPDEAEGGDEGGSAEAAPDAQESED